MATIESTVPAQRFEESTIEPATPSVSRLAVGLRPVAHWVQMPDVDGRNRLTMVWAVPESGPGDRA